MAITPANIRIEDATLTVAGSAKGTWVVSHRDARTAQTTANLYNPTGVLNTSFVDWIPVPAGVTRVLVRARIPKATSAITTSPVVRVFGAYKGNAAADIISTLGVVPTDGTVQCLRLDAASMSAAGQTVTLTCATTTTNNDATYFYSSPIDLDGYDIKGADYVAVFVETASAITASAACEIQVLLLN